MRLLSGPVGLAAATLLSCISSVTASPEPNFEISKTSVEIDRHRERLDNGEIVIRVQRTQDLFADATDNADARLLMERDTHLLLHLQLDADKGKINVNDASLDLTPGKLGEVAIAGIKATSYRIPNGEGKTVMSVQEVNSLMEQMSTGIVGVEVKLESEPITPSVPVAHFKDAETQPEIGAMTIRRVGLWIRITEVEGKSIPHTTAIFTPILQLIVTDSGNQVEKIQTLAIDGKAPLEKEALAAMPGPAMVKGGLPDVKPMPPHARPQPPQLHDGHRGHGHHEQPSGLLGWLSRTLDLSRWSPDRAQKGAGQPPRRPCHMRKPVPASIPGAAPAEPVNTHTGEGKVVGHRPMLDNPFSGMADDDEGYASGSEKDMDKLNAHVRPHHEGPHSHSHPHPHHGYHHQHHHHKSTKCGRFFRRMAIGFVYGLAMFGAFLMHPTTLFAVSGLAFGGLLFAGVRAIVKKRRAGQLRLGEDGDLGNEAEEPLLGMSEKEKEVLSLQEVIIEGENLPVYEPRS